MYLADDRVARGKRYRAASACRLRGSIPALAGEASYAPIRTLVLHIPHGLMEGVLNQPQLPCLLIAARLARYVGSWPTSSGLAAASAVMINPLCLIIDATAWLRPQRPRPQSGGHKSTKVLSLLRLSAAARSRIRPVSQNRSNHETRTERVHVPTPMLLVHQMGCLLAARPQRR